MSLFRPERRDYAGTGFLDPNAIPSNGSASVFSAALPGNPEAAMRHWAVWACVRIIADIVSTLPIDCYGKDRRPVEPVPTKLVKPAAYLSSIEWRWQVMASLLLRGNAYGLISSTDRLGYPTQVDLLSPDRVRVELVDGKKMFRVGNVLLGVSDVWHLSGPQMPGELEGMSPIRYAARTIGLGLDAERFGSDYFQRGISPTAVATTDQQVTPEQAQVIKDRIKAAVRNREMPVLGAGLKLEPWQVNAEESQFLETQRHNAVSVAQIFGVPPEMIGAGASGASITYANREQRAQDFLQNAVNPWLTRLETSLSGWFPAGTYVKFNTGALLRSDITSRFGAYNVGIRAGFMEPSEARAFEDWEPIPGIDDRPRPTDQQTVPAGGGNAQ